MEIHCKHPLCDKKFTSYFCNAAVPGIRDKVFCGASCKVSYGKTHRDRFEKLFQKMRVLNDKIMPEEVTDIYRIANGFLPRRLL